MDKNVHKYLTKTLSEAIFLSQQCFYNGAGDRPGMVEATFDVLAL